MHGKELCYHSAVYYHCTKLVDWTGGLTLKIIFMLSNDTHSPVYSCVEALQLCF